MKKVKCTHAKACTPTCSMLPECTPLTGGIGPHEQKLILDTRTERKKEWAKARGYIKCESIPCLRRLAGLRCGHRHRNDTSRADCCFGSMRAGGVLDHVSMWQDITHRPVAVLLQPYNLDMDGMRCLIGTCFDLGLVFSTSVESWHNPGRTLSVLITRRHRSPYA